MENKDVHKEYFYSVLKVGAVVLLAFIVSLVLIYCSCLCTCHFNTLAKIARVVGLLIIGSAVLGRLGWKIQTWSGETPAEKLNLKLFRMMYYVGIFFTALSLMI